mgnify:CR=1 FL=1
MSEFSLDDILDEYGKKDSSRTSDIDAEDILKDILGEQSESDDRIRRRRELRTAELTFGKKPEAVQDEAAVKDEDPGSVQLELENKRREEEREKERRKLEEIREAGGELNDDFSAAVRDPFRDLFSDPLSGAGNDRSFSFKIPMLHTSLLFHLYYPAMSGEDYLCLSA